MDTTRLAILQYLANGEAQPDEVADFLGFPHSTVLTQFRRLPGGEQQWPALVVEFGGAGGDGAACTGGDPAMIRDADVQDEVPAPVTIPAGPHAVLPACASSASAELHHHAQQVRLVRVPRLTHDSPGRSKNHQPFVVLK
ncbi:winged helix-turn-helix domain-containing protein [Streptomyces sp. NBC_01808]|uniref:winged helix-turn-helix domain-containing protein n=1 Tax=Streptomyces sp. NBC_01808 TaxID=2975947 RepID=UPI002DDBD1CB|nr:winged helix-turn-helix domain-containing protein [Streptomyces sp. NBC_01808]WSA38349.1 winged helix-turn-helix domain-containing protein [Streptomyces sp. NBC_01808]